MKRIGIYCCQPSDCTIRAYIPRFLEHFREVMDYLVVAINGDMDRETAALLVDCSDDLFSLQENRGIASVYKEAIHYIGWEALREYDELILTDSEMVGPFYPFLALFDRIDEEADFWGLYNITTNDADGKSVYGIFPHFLAFRKKALLSQSFSDFWSGADGWDAKNDKLLSWGYTLEEKLKASDLQMGVAFAKLEPEKSGYERVSLLTEWMSPVLYKEDLHCLLEQDIWTASQKGKPQPIFDAAIVAYDIPTAVVPGETIAFKVTVRNCGNQIWSEAEQFRLCLWIEGMDQGRVFLPDFVRVNPGEQFTFSCESFVWKEQGETAVAFQMLKEGICYFGEKRHVILSSTTHEKADNSGEANENYIRQILSERDRFLHELNILKEEQNRVQTFGELLRKLFHTS